ncbi:hypothetical protein FGO68_gene7931 [Halteria grandinella]|uniref:Phospholipase/carboxylesterase/thioesterase domain-containing protein n=1 Tax=Halteria grandinella TaxID=5974 RepID=A0A8J8NLL4_HALGN|nr:hypothetical protein FGO68_gene7931 [Halteria grandinella]
MISHLIVPSSNIILGKSANRPVSAVLPFFYHSNKAVPLIVLLHGYTASGPVQNLYFNLHQHARFGGYALLYPNGLTDAYNKRYWTATDACCDFAHVDYDDAAYIKGLIDELSSKANIDQNRIFLVGHSNGAFMSYRMACEYPELLAGIVTLAGATYYDNSVCTAKGDAADRKLSILHIHGTQDTTIRYTGGSILGVPYPSVTQTIASWQSNLGCTVTDLVYDSDLNIELYLKGKETKVYKTADGTCPDGRDITKWEVYGGSHMPIFGLHFPHHVFQWLNAHSRL